MNIKISKEDSIILDKYTVSSIIFGSKTGNDTDVLNIVASNSAMDSCVVNRDHFLFYKDAGNNVDKLYATKRCIINGLITGSSDLPYKMLSNGMFHDTALSFLHDYDISTFETSKLVKCLLGCAERDMKQSGSHKEKDKKLFWSNEYYKIAKRILADNGINCDDIGDKQLDLSDIKALRRLSGSFKRFIEPDLYQSINYACISDIGATRNTDEISHISKYYFNEWCS